MARPTQYYKVKKIFFFNKRTWHPKKKKKKVLDEAQILARICKTARNLHDSNKKYTQIYIILCIYIYILTSHKIS